MSTTKITVEHAGDDGKKLKRTIILKKGIIDPHDILYRDEYFAMKLWSRDDVAQVLSEKGYEPTEENIDKVINHGGKWHYLNDCHDSEWDCISEEVMLAMKGR